MQRFESSLPLDVSADVAYRWHVRPGAFRRLVPPWDNIRVPPDREGIHEGLVRAFKVKKGPIGLTWKALHRDFVPGRQFVDEQIGGPFSHWVHTHALDPGGDGGSTLTDSIEYKLPLGFLGRWLGGRSVRKMLNRMFTFRHARTAHDLRRHSEYTKDRIMRIAITGASGLIGTALGAYLGTGGHEVLRLVRRETQAPDEVFWKPSAGEIDAARLEGVDAVIHLAGANVGDQRWSDERKALIMDSRTEGTGLIARALAGLENKPKVLISASAIGIYGDERGDEVLTEDASAGGGFLAEVCEAWEAAADPAREAGIRVVHPRIGVVLSAEGGALDKMLTPFKAGVGGPIGGGQQWMSWVSMDDVIAAIHHCIATESLEGPVNVCSPNPETNKAFTKTLGRVIRRPTFMPVPAFAIKTLYGQMGKETVLASQRVQPARLLASGFEFSWPDLEGCLRHELGR